MRYKELKVSMLIFLLGLGALHAQDAVPTAGGEATGLGGGVSYTIGQVVYVTNLGSNGSMAEGVQQPYEISTLVGNEVSYIQLELKAYPNPAIDHLILEIDTEDPFGFHFELYDLRGETVGTGEIVNRRTNIPLEDLSSSIYFLAVRLGEKPVKTFKIIKQ